MNTALTQIQSGRGSALGALVKHVARGQSTLKRARRRQRSAVGGRVDRLAEAHEATRRHEGVYQDEDGMVTIRLLDVVWAIGE